MSADAELLRTKLNLETARIEWPALARFFAQGRLIWVDAGLDLVEVAYQLARDDAEGIAAAQAHGQLAPVSDEQARRWLAAGEPLWAVVVRPWVLVQGPV